MQKLLARAAVGASLLVLTSAAQADGYSAPRAYERPFSWTGFYLGGHAGGAWADVDWNPLSGGNREPLSADPSGVIGGGQVGVQYQWGSWLAGIELSGSGPEFSGLSSTAPPDRSRGASIGGIFLATARLGWAVDRSLFYVDGGYANARLSLDSHVVSTGLLTTFSSKREDGWTIGAGWEYALFPNVIVGLQYDFISLIGTDRHNVQQPGFATTDHLDVNADIQRVTARLSFLLGDQRARPLK